MEPIFVIAVLVVIALLVVFAIRKDKKKYGTLDASKGNLNAPKETVEEVKTPSVSTRVADRASTTSVRTAPTSPASSSPSKPRTASKPAAPRREDTSYTDNSATNNALLFGAVAGSTYTSDSDSGRSSSSDSGSSSSSSYDSGSSSSSYSSSSDSGSYSSDSGSSSSF